MVRALAGGFGVFFFFICSAYQMRGFKSYRSSNTTHQPADGEFYTLTLAQVDVYLTPSVLASCPGA